MSGKKYARIRLDMKTNDVSMFGTCVLQLEFHNKPKTVGKLMLESMFCTKH